MRTRFLGTEFFRSFPIETSEFFHCSLPQLPPANGSTQGELPYSFNDIPVFNISLKIEKLPIDDCLCKFLSGVLPQKVEVDIGNLIISESGSACIDERSCGIEHEENDDTFTVGEIDNLGSRTEKDKTDLLVTEKNDLESLYFEIPEVDPLSMTQDHDIRSQMENHMNLFEIANDVDTLDMPTFEIRQQDFLGIIQELVSVDNITDSFIETKIDPTEDSSSTELDSPPTFLHFEVDEACMGIFNDTPIECTLTAILHIEFQKVTEYDDAVNNEVEFPRLQTFDLLEYLSVSNLELQGYNAELPPSNLYADLSFIDQPEGLQPEHMLNQPGKSNDYFVSSEGMLLFEDFQFIELELCSVCEVFVNVAMVVKIEACEDMFGEAMKFRSFNELIVCNELTLSDNLFKALPVPILSDCHILRSLESFVQESLKDLDLQFPSMFDGLYLDWYVLEEENGGHNTYSSCWKTMVEKDMNIICTALDSLDYEVLILNFVLADDIPYKINLEDKKEMLNIPFCDSSVPRISANQRGRDYGEIESAKVLVSINSMAQGSDDFFLNPQTCVRGLNHKAFEPSLDTSKLLSVDCSEDSMAACVNPELPIPRWNIKLRRIKLSDEIVGILNSFRRNFLVMLEDDKGSKVDMFSCHGLDDLSLFRSPKEKLMKQIENESATGSGKSILLAAICAFKQMAWYLCYYGFRSSYIYIRNFLEGMQCLKYRLSFLQNWTEEMCGRAEKEVVKFHPSLPVIKELLELNVIQNGKKMLIVAERLFRWPLKRLLDSMKISYDEPPDFSAYTHEGNEWMDRVDAKNINFQSDCCLISHEYMNASFPYGKFHSVLEYGGPCESSRISMISPELDDFPFLYFLKVDFEDSALAEALCHGVDMPKHVGKMNDDCYSIAMMSKTKNDVIELLNFIPFENFKMEPKGAVNEYDAFSTMQVPQSSAADSDKIKGKKLNFTLSEDFEMEQKGAEDNDDAFSAMQVPQSLIAESEKINGNNPGFLDTVIIVNTQNLDKEMIISRRSTYQKILAMEKRGVQVVERDLNLPVDILVDAAVCMVWYDVKNIRNKASAPDEAFSSLPLCIENIAASILTALSFAFSSCILIFEGEKSFIAGVMESSDELYAAAASLGIDLQIFYSYSSETTDKIILSTIETSAKNTEPSSSYPKMYDSESLAESFLTAFPSLNPLSAHAILSCGATLAEFLECSHDCRVQALQKFKVPDEAISLFTLLAKYGEREDSKSALTDSSSSVTYGPGNHNKHHMKSYPENKKRKFDEDLLDVDICPKKTNFEPIACPDDLWKSESLDDFGEFMKPRLSFDAELLAEKEEFDANMMSKEMKKWDDSWNKIVSDETETTWDKTSMKKLKQQKLTNSWNQIDKGEVIDIDNYSNPNSFDFCNPYSVKREIGKDSSERTRGVARKLFSSSNSLSGFPASVPSILDKKGPAATDRNYLDSGFNKYDLSSSLKGHIIEDTVHTTASNPREHLSQEREYLSETPLWNAMNSSQCIGQSPWTMEFLNKVRAKSKSRERSLPPELLGSRNASKAVKRRSPSIIEFYKYQGDHHVGKSEQQQRKKRPVQPQGSSKSKIKTTSDSTPPTWTPLDKRAKSTLSFTTSGNGAQSKLIWSDGKFQTRML